MTYHLCLESCRCDIVVNMTSSISRCESCRNEKPFLLRVKVTHDIKTITKDLPTGEPPYIET